MPCRPLVAAALALALLAVVPLAAQDPAPPELRLPDGARPLAVRADLTLLPEREDFEGRVEIDLELARPASWLWLNGSRLEVGTASLTVGGETRPLRAVAGGEEFLGFDLGGEVPAGAATLVVSYRGKLDPVETEGLFRQSVGDDHYVFSQFEPTFARRAFPCFDEPSYRAPWQLTLHVRREHLALANTPARAEREEPDGMKAVEFEPTPPIPSYLVALGVGPFAVVDAGRWGKSQTPVRIVVPRGQQGRAGFAAEVTGELLARLEDYFEIPYAFGKLDNLTVPQTVGFSAMENPGLVTYAERVILVDPANAAVGPRRRYVSTMTHENAHQWFGNLVTMAWWDDIWLNEGFAEWIADKVVAAWKPEWFTAADRVERRGWALRSDSLPSARQVRRPIRSGDDIVTAFDGISYAKGASLLEMYEAWMGPEAFRAGIQRYLKRHAWGNATSDDFLAALAGNEASEVARSFASYLDQPGAPVIAFERSCPDNGPARLGLVQRRYVPLGSEVPAGQRWTVPVRLRYGADGRSDSARVLVEGERAVVDLAYCPSWIAGNDEGVGYYVASYPADLLEALAGGAGGLSAGEQIALLGDAALLQAAGELSPASALGLLPRFAGSPYRQVTEAAIEIAGAVDQNLVDATVRPNYERFLSALFGARLRELGLDPRPGEALDDALIRPRLATLLAGAGGDREVARAARARIDAWLADRSALAPDLVGSYLEIAARAGDAALFDRLAATLAGEPDARVRRQLFAALGSFREPQLVGRALGLIVSGRHDPREAGWMLRTLADDRVNRQPAYDWVKASWDGLVAKLPAQSASYLVFTGSGFCDAEHRRDLEEFFRPRTANLPGGEILLGQALDVVDICIARRAAQQGAVTEFLRGY